MENSDDIVSNSPLGNQIRIGVDVGGTFTDMVLVNEKGDIDVIKVPTVPEDPGKGVINAIEDAAKIVRSSNGHLLKRCKIFVQGSTIATNTMLEGKGAKVGLIATTGFRDSLEIRRGIRKDQWAHRNPYPEVLVPRYLRATISGRIDNNGEEIEPFQEAALPNIVDNFERGGVESIAVCLFNSYLNDKHEIACRNLLKQLWKNDWISCSANIVPIMGEYERTSSTVINAYISIRTVSYLKALDRELRNRGLDTQMLIIQNNGGAISIDQVSEKPATLLLSGPAAAVGSLNYFSRITGIENLISMEIGGTSCDVILMSNGQVNLTESLDIADYHLALPSVEVHTIGAGGGTIAGVDAANMMFVGPKGAGAVPGPACYGLGGDDPTVTDAHVVLGRLKAGTYARGALNIDEVLARKAIDRRISSKLKITTEEAANGIIRLMEQKLLHAVQLISIQRGYDPREFTLVAAGGAGPMHGAQIGRLLGCPRVYIPRLAGTFCALGMLYSDVRHDFVRVHFSKLDLADPLIIGDIYKELEKSAVEILKAEGFNNSNIVFRRGLSLRYAGQQWDISLQLIEDEFNSSKIRTAFEIEHQRLFGHIQPDGEIEITKLSGVGLGKVPSLRHKSLETIDIEPEPNELRSVWIDEAHGWQKVPVYDGNQLGPSQQIIGPAVINEDTSTIIIGVKDHLKVDNSNNYMIELHN